MRNYRVLLVPAILSTFFALTGRAEESSAEILWDKWGVPHIFAANAESLFYAQGWAQTASHGNLLLELYGRSRGQGAEYFGDKHLSGDRWLRRMGVPARAARWYQEQSPRERALLDAFARGINEYTASHRAEIDDRAEAMLPVSGTDVLAHIQQVIHFTFVVDKDSVGGLAQRLETPGSNAWAVAPKRSASGHAMLVANPHLPWGDLFTWFENQLVAPGVNAYGAALVGTPFLGIGFNDHLGWTHTVKTFDGADLFALTLTEGGYHFDGAVKAFERHTETLKIRQSDGSLREETLEIKSSAHGPVVAEKGDKALALRVVGLEQSHLAEQYWQMATATNLEEFERAISRLEMPMFTVMYADRAGHILHVFGGRTPVRPAGDWNWNGIVPGDSSATLWTKTHTYNELPRVLDPPSGWLQNANDPPWTTTFPLALDANRFPKYLAPRSMSLRAQRSARMLAEDESISFEELTTYKLSTRMELADRILDDLRQAVSASGNEEAATAMGVLVRWDRSADNGSAGAVLFERFWRKLTAGGKRPWSKPWSEADPRNTPDGLSDPTAAVAALVEAAREVRIYHGAADTTWGSVFRLAKGNRDLKSNGGPGDLGIFRVVNYEVKPSRARVANGGDSFVYVAEFGPTVKAQALLSYGNASQPGHPHNGDQLVLFSDKELRPVWRTRAEIEANLEKRERVGG